MRRDTTEVTSRYAFLYFMKPLPDRIHEVVPQHVRYWQSLRLDGYMGGPFSDRSGGLITFEAPDLEAASRLVAEDPFVVNDLLEERWIKEWRVEGA